MSKLILHIAEASGGVERYLVTLLTKLKQYPDYEHVLVCSTTYDTNKFDNLVSKTIIINDLHNAISPLSDFKSILRVRKAILKTKPNIIYCHSSKAGAIGRIANIGIHNSLIYNPHGWAFNMKNTSRVKLKLYETVEKLLAPMSDRIVCISEYEREAALAHKICKANKLITINNGIDFDEFRNLQQKTRSSLGIPDDAYVVGTIGRLATQKAPDTFIKMAIEVKKHISKSFFLMVGDDIGDGHCRREIEKQINDAGLTSSVKITGWVDNPLAYLNIFDVATLFSRWEGFGLVLPEYMYMGKPIVATKADAIPNILGDAGLMIDIDDYTQAAKSVILLYENGGIRNKIVEAAKKRSGLFDAQRTADEHIRVFTQLCEQQHSARVKSGH